MKLFEGGKRELGSWDGIRKQGKHGFRAEKTIAKLLTQGIELRIKNESTLAGGLPAYFFEPKYKENHFYFFAFHFLGNLFSPPMRKQSTNS